MAVRPGPRLIGRQPYAHWTTTTFTAGLRCDGIAAPFVLNRAMNREAFLLAAILPWRPAARLSQQPRGRGAEQQRA